MRNLHTIVCLLLFIFSGSSWGQEQSENNQLNLSGFGTLGFVHSSNRDADYVRDLLQHKGVGRTRQLDFGVDSLLGVQADYAFHDELSVTAQMVSRRAQLNFRPELTWGFLRYVPNDTVQMRLGRLGFDVYLLADSRNVGYSYQWVRPPIEFFGSLIVSHLDGGDVVIKKALANGVLKLKVFSGTAQEKASIGSARDDYFSLVGSPLWGGHIEYVDQHWHARLGYTQMHFKNEFPAIDQLASSLQLPLIQRLDPNAAQYAEQVRFKDKRIQYLAAGLAYDRGPLQAQVMMSRLHSAAIGYPSNNAAYVTLSYRNGKWTPYLGYSQIKSTHRAPSLNVPLGLDSQIDAIASGFHLATHGQLADQKNQTLGLRYDLSETTNVKIQLEHIRSQHHLLIRNYLPRWDGRTTLFSFAFNFVF